MTACARRCLRCSSITHKGGNGHGHRNAGQLALYDDIDPAARVGEDVIRTAGPMPPTASRGGRALPGRGGAERETTLLARVSRRGAVVMRSPGVGTYSKRTPRRSTKVARRCPSARRDGRHERGRRPVAGQMVIRRGEVGRVMKQADYIMPFMERRRGAWDRARRPAAGECSPCQGRRPDMARTSRRLLHATVRGYDLGVMVPEQVILARAREEVDSSAFGLITPRSTRWPCAPR